MSTSTNTTTPAVPDSVTALADRPAFAETRLEWEARPAHGRIPYADEDNVRDASYIRTRIQDAMRRAKGVRANYSADTDSAELSALTVHLQQLMEELRYHTRAADELLETLRFVAPELHWGRGGTLHAFVDDEVTAQDSATRLRLRAIESDTRRTWRGTHEGLEVSIYGPLA